MLLDLRGFWPPRRLGSLRGAPGGPLAPHYGIGPGKITIHFDVDHTTRDGSGNVIALQNRGGGGAVFDATVSGAAIPVTGGALQMTAAGGVPILANPADIQGVRLMWIMGRDDLTPSMRIFGRESADIYNIRLTSNGLRLYADGAVGGVSGGSNLHGTNTPFAAPQTSLFELELRGATSDVWMDGASLGSAPLALIFHASFIIDRIGRGGTLHFPLVGRMGDVLGVTLGAGDAAAIAAARAYLAARHGVVLA